MRPASIRLFALGALAAGVLAIAGCDTRSLTAARSTRTSTGAGTPPTVVIDTPVVGALVNVGDSIFVRVRLQDLDGLARVDIGGLTLSGDPDLGTFQETPRYATTSVTFRPGLVDTVIRRYIKPLSATDTVPDSLIVFAIAADSTGALDTARVRVQLVTGPAVSILAPTPGDSVPAGVGVGLSVRATHPDGVGRIEIRVRGEANWPTPLDTTIVQTVTGTPREVTMGASARIPLNAPLRSRITITATALDVNRQPGSASPVVVFVRSPSAAQPRVTQTVAARTEITDSIQIKATGEGIVSVGVVVRDSTGAVVRRDSILLPQPVTSNVQTGFPLNLPLSQQGRRLSVTAFAVDLAGRTGYAVRASQNAPEGSLDAALADSTLVVHGRTFTLARRGLIGDLVVDQTRGNVFLSNTDFNRLEVWQNPARAFDASGVAVGSLPWGLAVSSSPDTLLVANSGGTNISRVFIGSTAVPSIREDLARRILTRNTYAFVVTEARDENTGKVRLTGLGPISYSDRPQYVAQSAGGRIFYSTRPTPSAPSGTIRWLDPTLPVPDPRQVWQYGTVTNSTVNTYVIFNVDSIAFRVALASDTTSDSLYVWDHPYGQSTGVVFRRSNTVAGVVAALAAGGSDAEAVLRLDIASLNLTDTTFVAASGNRKWIAFGEGNTGGSAGRVIMVADSMGVQPNFYSPVVTVRDLTDNASEAVFGLALDLTGRTVASHGLQSYFSTVFDPFHLRLQGKFDTFDNGAGIALHPSADGQMTPAGSRLAFVAAASGVIELVDIAYYISRGRLQLKSPIYGPLRVSGPMPGDPPEVVLKVFALTATGLIVIDLTAADIRPGP